MIGSFALPVIQMKWKFRQKSNRNESGDETEKIKGIEPEIDTIRNFQVDFDNRKEVKEKVECDKDIKDCNSNVNVSSVVTKLTLRSPEQT